MNRILSTAIFLLISYLSLFGQLLDKAQKAFIEQNAIPLNVDSNYQNGNWSPVLEVIKDKRLVFLGEFNHGSKEVFLSRNELIKVLHKELGFNLILFESGIGEVGVVNLKKNGSDGFSLTSGFFGGWRTQEFETLLQYIKEHDIQIGGYDVQRTGSTFTDYLSEKLEDPQAFREIEATFVALKRQLANYRTDYASVKDETQELIKEYQKITNNLPEQDHFSIRTIENRINFLTYMLEFVETKDWNARWKARDLAMAENIKWLLNQYGPNQKAIVIAHNFHISKSNEKEEVMGEFLVKDFAAEMYVLGGFAKEGRFLNNSGKAEHLSEPDSTSLDIKHIIEADKAKMSFLNIPKEYSKGSRWLFEPIIVNDTFIDLFSSNELILSECFDGLLLLDKVSPPSK